MDFTNILMLLVSLLATQYFLDPYKRGPYIGADWYFKVLYKRVCSMYIVIVEYR